MKKMVRNLLLGTSLAGMALLTAAAQDRVEESSTGKSFETQTVFTHNGSQYAQKLTGVTVRKKLVFKVYAMAHYMQDPAAGSKEAALESILSDGKAKQITMVFVRDVDRQKIQDAYRDGFKENATAEDLKKMQPSVDQFVSFFSSDVKEDDQFVLHWLPGGVVIANVQGTEKPEIKDPLFARTLWSIWFGEDSIVRRNDLVSRMIP